MRDAVRDEELPPPEFDLRKAVAAGLAAGICGTAVKTICELLSPPRPPGQPSPLGRGIAIVFTAATGHEISDPALHVTEIVLHWFFGTGAGVAYSVLAERFRLATIGYGIVFGIVFWLFLHEMLLPLLGWSASPFGMTFHEQGNEFVSHCFYGLAAEMTRRSVRRKLSI